MILISLEDEELKSRHVLALKLNVLMLGRLPKGKI